MSTRDDKAVAHARSRAGDRARINGVVTPAAHFTVHSLAPVRDDTSYTAVRCGPPPAACSCGCSAACSCPASCSCGCNADPTRYAPRLACSALRSSYSACDDMYAHGVPPSMYPVGPGPSTACGARGGAGWKSSSGGCHATVPGVGGPCGPCAGTGCGGCDVYSNPFPTALNNANPSPTALNGANPFPVALGYAAYVSPSVSPSAFSVGILGPWRVALPASCDPHDASRILERINSAGPRNAGYVRMGDTLVPAYLNAVDRRRVALSLM